MEKNRGGGRKFAALNKRTFLRRPLMESNTQHHITLQCTPTIQGENFKNCISTSEQNTNMYMYEKSLRKSKFSMFTIYNHFHLEYSSFSFNFFEIYIYIYIIAKLQVFRLKPHADL